MNVDDFDFPLPQELIAQVPLERRDASRLLHVERDSGWWTHRQFAELPSLVGPGDLLVFNDTKVFPARLLGKKVGSGGRVELLLIRPEAHEPTARALQGPVDEQSWRCLGQASKPMRAGAQVELDGGLSAQIEAAFGNGEFRVRFSSTLGSLAEAIERAGRVPLPPYIERAPDAAEAVRYNTVFAAQPGSVAAPTAGLHFTQELLTKLDATGAKRATVTLEVGPGTFLPIRGNDLGAHRMHSERYEIPQATVDAIVSAKRVIAVGTTVARALESSADTNGVVRAGPSETTIFIHPPYEFRVVDALITNFHLPKSTLLMLVSALMGRDRALSAYSEAVRERYRFFSYGDAMFIDGPAH